MDSQELRQLAPEELKVRIGNWKEESFRLKFKGQTSEVKDTSQLRKLRRTIARAATILREKELGMPAPAAKAVKTKAAAAPEDKPVAKKKTAKKTAKKEE